jgi:hypothetical protein
VKIESLLSLVLDSILSSRLFRGESNRDIELVALDSLSIKIY